MSVASADKQKGNWKLFFGAPSASELKTVLETRFSKDYEKAVVFLDRIVDRQIIKTGALLTFNSILLAGLRISIDHGPYWVKVTNSLGSLGALLTCVVLLFFVMRVTWNAATSYQTANIEFENTLALLHKRSYVINIFALLSVVGGLAAVLEGIAVLF
jgi:hypothetical protein